MEIQSAFNAGVQGYQNATQQASEAASNIVDATVATQEDSAVSTNNSAASNQSIPNLNEEIVNLKVAEYQAKASAEVIKTADETLGTLLDVTA
ncbi:hypothetical protein [Colwellia sp. MEBiC06753]